MTRAELLRRLSTAEYTYWVAWYTEHQKEILGGLGL